MIRKLAAGVALAILSVGAANAQSPGIDGTFGTTSEGSFTINATLAPVVRVSGLNNLTFNIDAAFLNGSNPNINQRFNYCVYSNVSSAGSYRLSVNGGPVDPGYVNGWLLTGANGSLPFSMSSSDGVVTRVMGPGDTQLFESDNRFNNRPDTADCSDTGENTQIVVAIDRARILASNAGTYAGTVRVIASAL